MEHMEEKEKNNQDSPERPERRSFLKGTAAAAGAIAAGSLLGPALAAAAKMPVPKGCGCTGKVVSQKLTHWERRDADDGPEYIAHLEVTDEAGKTHAAKAFMKRTDHPDNSYTVTHRMSFNDIAGGTLIMSGKKGEVNGDYRIDKMQITVIDDAGTVQRSPEQQVRVLVTNPYPGLSPQEMLDAHNRERR
jgi:hypothetical protein